MSARWAMASAFSPLLTCAFPRYAQRVPERRRPAIGKTGSARRCVGVLAPLEWANEAIALYRARQADRIIAEVNNGGDMVENTYT